MTDLYIFNREISIVELDKDVSKYYFSSDWLLNMEIQKSSVFYILVIRHCQKDLAYFPLLQKRPFSQRAWQVYLFPFSQRATSGGRYAWYILGSVKPHVTQRETSRLLPGAVEHLNT